MGRGEGGEDLGCGVVTSDVFVAVTSLLDELVEAVDSVEFADGTGAFCCDDCGDCGDCGGGVLVCCA